MQAQATFAWGLLFALVLAVVGFFLLIALAVVLIRYPAQAPKILGGVALGGLGLVLFAATFLVGVRQASVTSVRSMPDGSHVEIRWDDGHRQEIVHTQQAQQRVTVVPEAAGAQDSDHGHAEEHGHGPADIERPATPSDSAHAESDDHPQDHIGAPVPTPATKVIEHSSNLLWARQQASDAPAWANLATSPDSPLVVVSTDPYATEEEATRLQLTPRVVTAVTQKLRARFRDVPQDSTVPVELINQYGVREIVREEFQKDFGLGKPEPMYKLHARVEVTPELQQAVHRLWKKSIVNDRLWQFGGATGLGVLVVALTAGFLRLNSATMGRARGILTVVLAAIAIGMGLLGVLFLA